MPEAEVFVSYSRQDLPRVRQIVDSLREARMALWFDEASIQGGTEWAAEIVRGIDACKVVLLMCSNASMRSSWVKKEIQVAGQQDKPFLPLLLEQTEYPDQVRLFLSGVQWIDVRDTRPSGWMPSVIQALGLSGVHGNAAEQVTSTTAVAPTRIVWDFKGLRDIASLTDQIWPLPTRKLNLLAKGTTRGMGAPQEGVQHQFRMGDRVSIAIENDRSGHLMLINEGAEGVYYCLCPSHFAPATDLPTGRSYLPQQRSHYDAFVLSGQAGREHLTAIISDEPLGCDWMPAQPHTPARVLTKLDLDQLCDELRQRPATSWTALSTYFDVAPESTSVGT